MKPVLPAALLLVLLTAAPALAQHQHSSGLDSGDLKPGQSWETHFDEPGNVTYHCHPHPFMEGRVEVTDEAPNGTVEVRIKDFEYVPAVVQVRPNEIVRFVNDGPSVHTVNEGTGGTGTKAHGGSPGPGLLVVVAVLGLALLFLARRRA